MDSRNAAGSLDASARWPQRPARMPEEAWKSGLRRQVQAAVEAGETPTFEEVVGNVTFEISGAEGKGGQRGGCRRGDCPIGRLITAAYLWSCEDNVRKIH